ncbi:hypothetical protein MMC25_000011 [Agyrium rufum]|nr:hypothetical protein [Agyrium rufum]
MQFLLAFVLASALFGPSLANVNIVTQAGDDPSTNCKGSQWCGQWARKKLPFENNIGNHDQNKDGSWFSLPYEFYHTLSSGSDWIKGGPVADDVMWVQPKIICWHTKQTVCLFSEGDVPKEGISTKTIKRVLRMMMDANCLHCGSAPIAEDGSNSQGRLTINWVMHHPECPMDVCKSSQGPANRYPCHEEEDLCSEIHDRALNTTITTPEYELVQNPTEYDEHNQSKKLVKGASKYDDHEKAHQNDEQKCGKYFCLPSAILAYLW